MWAFIAGYSGACMAFIYVKYFTLYSGGYMAFISHSIISLI